MKPIGFALFLSSAVALSGCGPAKLLLAPATPPPPKGAGKTVHGPAYAPARVVRGAPDPATDWGAYNKTRSGNRFSPLAQINAGNVGDLEQACAFTLDKPVNMQSSLIEIGGTLYFTSLEDTYAVDASTCTLRWRRTYQLARSPPFDPNKVNRGVGWLDGKLFRGSNDGRLYALDAATGAELWNVPVGDPDIGETFPAAPVAWNGRVYIGNAGGDNFGVTGRMMAFDANTGGKLWSADLVPTSGPASQTWPPSTAQRPRAGAATWTSYTLDTQHGLLWVPTGNAAPDFLKSLRPGRNLYTYSVVALDANTGAVKHAEQLVTEDDFHDWDIAAPPALIDTPDGDHLLVAAGKNGYLYALDRDTLKPRYKTPVTRMENVSAPLTAQGTHFCPGIDGGVEWNGPAYSPRTNAFYLNAIDWCITVATRAPDQLEGRKGLPWTGAKDRKNPFGVPDKQRSGWVTAVNAKDGSILWQYHARAPLVSGITATAGGVVFTADIAGDFMAFDARSGRLLWQRNLGQPIGGGVIAYSVDGKEYIAVASGMDSPLGWQVHSTPARVVVFALR